MRSTPHDAFAARIFHNARVASYAINPDAVAQAERLIESDDLTHEMIRTLIPADLPVDPSPVVPKLQGMYL